MLGFDDTGRGDPLVLVHGLATTRAIWRHVVPLLGERRVIALDVPGFGASPAAGPGFGLEDVARTVLRELPVDEPFDLVGHSMGGAVALTMAAVAPERVRRLVLFAPAGLRPVPEPLARAFGAIGETLIHARRIGAPLAALPWGRRFLLAAGTVDGAAFSSSDVREMVTASHGAERIGSALARVAGADLRPLLAQAPGALGLLWGAEDRIIPAELIETVLVRRPDAVAATIPDAGHIAMMERPAAFAATLEHLLGELAVDSTATS
jgi:pimeloyl-ACP methyl ester carboxylesterase